MYCLVKCPQNHGIVFTSVVASLDMEKNIVNNLFSRHGSQMCLSGRLEIAH